jgi:hypothetical protein
LSPENICTRYSFAERRRRRTTVVVSRGTYQNGVPYLRNHGRDPLADDVVLADVDEVEGVPKSMGVDRGTLACTTPTKMRDCRAAPWRTYYLAR